MAALCACDDYVLLASGNRAAVVRFRLPDKVELLELPIVEDVVNKPHKQAPGKKQKEIIQQQGSKIEDAGQGPGINQKDRPSTEEENRILACAVSSDGQFLAFCDDKKTLHVFQMADDSCRLCFSRSVAHRCTAVTFTRNSQQVIVADKSGDAYVFRVRSGNQVESNGDSTSGSEFVCGGVEDSSMDCSDDSGGGTLLLGHHSMLLDVLTADNDKLIVTCDRDEKIRISHFPDAYNIRAYCLGHTEFVISLAFDDVRKVIMSASGDATIRLWSLDGRELCRKDVLPDIPAEDDKLQTCREVDMDTSNPAAGDMKNRTSKTAIQKICFCPEFGCLFVSIYKSPYVLVYSLSSTETGSHLTLNLNSVLSGQSNVMSMCTSRSVLWVVRQETSGLNVSGYKMLQNGDDVKLVSATDDTSSECTVLKTLSSQSNLLQVPANPLDLIPSLWKTTFHEDYKTNHKRTKEEEGNGRKGKKSKR